MINPHLYTISCNVICFYLQVNKWIKPISFGFSCSMIKKTVAKSAIVFYVLLGQETTQVKLKKNKSLPEK